MKNRDFQNRGSGDAFSRALFAMVVMLIIASAGISVLSAGSSTALLSTRTELLFAMIIALSVAGLMLDRRAFSIVKTHWLFVFFFLGVAPLIQCAKGYVPWSFPLMEDDIFNAQLVIVLWCGTVLAVTYGVNKRLGPVCPAPVPRNGIGQVSDRSLNALLACSIACTFVAAVVIGPNNLFVRPMEVEETGAATKIVEYFTRSFPAVVLILISKHYNWRGKRGLFSIAILVACVLIVNWPLTGSRYWTAAIYGSIIISYIPERCLSGRKFEIYGLLMLGVLFPMMYALKPDVGHQFNPVAAFRAFVTGDAYLSVDFDAFSMLARALLYVDAHGIAYGVQIISALLCFVPRNAWFIFDKSIATGEIVAVSQDAYYTNLAMPLMGEAFVDLSYVGVFLVAMGFAYASCFLDAKAERGESGSISFISLFYPLLIFLTIYVLRGALFHAAMRSYGLMLAPMAIAFCFKHRKDGR